MQYEECGILWAGIERFGSHLRLDRNQYNQQQCYALDPPQPSAQNLQLQGQICHLSRPQHLHSHGITGVQLPQAEHVILNVFYFLAIDGDYHVAFRIPALSAGPPSLTPSTAKPSAVDQ